MIPIPPPLLQTQRMMMRPAVNTDRDALIHAYARSWDSHLRVWSPRPKFADTDYAAMADEALARTHDGLATGLNCRLLAFDQAGAVAGGFNLNNIIRGSFQSSDAGWWVSVDHLRQGVATECVRALLRLALTPAPRSASSTLDGIRAGLGLHRMQCAIIPRNAASLRVAAKAGLRQEGLALQYLQINGRWEDHLIFARTLDDGPLA